MQIGGCARPRGYVISKRHIMTAEQELSSKYGIVIKQHKAGGLRLYSWADQGEGAGLVECHVAAGSPMEPLVSRAMLERGIQWPPQG